MGVWVCLLPDAMSIERDEEAMSSTTNVITNERDEKERDEKVSITEK